ncbi:MAG: LLM class flavin-dependent oxidoreductase [Alphaproteobacteria bacterium]|nr:LLM class flavin-dependent oxidoreductase [Alphaproteobacteria bacterium]
MEIGVYTFAETTPDPATGVTIAAGQRFRDLIEEVALADQVGLDVFGIGEHHRPDFIASAPPIILAAAAERTKRIKLTSAVTVLSSDDPVRVYQQFATLDLLSSGRAEIMAGRGSFIESFPLFGYDLDDYDTLFAEKLELLLEIREKQKVTWQGTHRPALKDQGIYPRARAELPIWVAVGGSAPSAVRAGLHGLPMALAIIGGMPERFKPFVDLYRRAADEAGHDPAATPVGINTHGYVADTTLRAADEFFPSYAAQMSRIGRERGWPPTTREQFDAGRTPRGHLMIGSPQEVIDKILFQREALGHRRYLMQMSVGTMPHAQTMRSIELFGNVVAPAVRKATAADNQPRLVETTGPAPSRA